MKVTLKYIIVGLLVISCGGSSNNNDTPPEETEKELGAFNLVFPENNLICTEGEDNGSQGISIEFQWSESTNATSYELAITNQENNSTDTRTVNSTSLTVGLQKGTQFSWTVTAIVDSKRLISDSWNFYSQGVATENFAPFPAEITVSENNNSTVTISWIGEDLDDDLANYDIYVGSANNMELILENTVTLSINYNIEAGQQYTVKVISKDNNNNSSSSELTFSF